MANLTISGLLSMEKSLRGRLSQLASLKDQVAKIERWHGEDNKEIIPTYDVKKDDAMLVEISNGLFVIDQAIKASNAVVTLDVAVDYQQLMRPIE